MTAYDTFGNVATGYNGTVYFTSTDADSHVALPSDYTFLGSDQGTRSFSGVVLQTPGSRTITATDTADYLITGHAAMSVTAVVTRFVVTGPASVVAGNPFSLTVTAEDASFNPVPTYTGTVQFSTTDTGAGVVLPSNYTFTGSAPAIRSRT